MPIETYDAHKSTAEVRQGSATRDNFVVLIVSTLLVVALFAIIFLVFFAQTPPTAISP